MLIHPALSVIDDGFDGDVSRPKTHNCWHWVGRVMDSRPTVPRADSNISQTVKVRSAQGAIYISIWSAGVNVPHT